MLYCSSGTLFLHTGIMLYNIEYWIVTSFRTQSSLGHGQFGGVHIGKWRTPNWEREVAIKMLDPTTSHQDDKVKFLQEAAIMAQFKHPNVIQLYGIVTDGQPVSCVYIVSVLMCNIYLCV